MTNPDIRVGNEVELPNGRTGAVTTRFNLGPFGIAKVKVDGDERLHSVRISQLRRIIQ